MANRRRFKGWTDEDLAKAVINSKSVANVLRILGLQPSGGNYLNIQMNIERLNLDVSHFTGQLWNKGGRLPLDKLRNTKTFKSTLLEQRGRRCESCLLSVWQNKSIPIELHHIDGNRCNNIEQNLQLLCPNCHSQTDNFRRRKSSLKENK